MIVNEIDIDLNLSKNENPKTCSSRVSEKIR